MYDLIQGSKIKTNFIQTSSFLQNEFSVHFKLK